MPSFLKTPADEQKWNAIKHSVAKQRGKKVEDFSDRDWATVNAAWHKSEGNLQKFEEIVKSLFAMPKLRIPSGLKMPKPKRMAKPTDKPSKFFKNEQSNSISKLEDFLKSKSNKIK